MKPFAEQWPAGGGRFEEAARVIEFLLQKWITPTPGQESIEGVDPARQKLARELLGSFLAHTDSSNVKLAQVYQYLMQRRRGSSRDAQTTAASLDVVCLRRYSSFFPFLPRPAAFRAPGGGYLVQVQGPGEDVEPFGIAVDPGPDFLDNLYKCGYGLADVQMIVLTHDHADHMACLDAMLTLLGIRMALGDDTFSREGNQCLAIVGNASIVERYGFFNEKTHPVLLDKKGRPRERSDPVRVLDFNEIAEVTAEDDPDARAGAGIRLDPTLRIEPVRTVDHTDATGNLSQGFLLSVGSGQERTSVLFTGDTGPEPSDPPLEPDSPRASQGNKTLKEAALEADVVVAHLSSVPLRELRELAADPAIDLEETTGEFEEIWRSAEAQIHSDKEDGAKQTKFLLEQLQFGFRARPNRRGDLSVSPLSPLDEIKVQSVKHLYLTGLLDLAEHMAAGARDGHRPLLLIGELREELGTFRTRIADHVTKGVFAAGGRRDHGVALTADIGLRVRLTRGGPKDHPSGRPRAAIPPGTSVLCTTCDLDNDLVASERFHAPHNIREVCVKGENEGVFYNCLLHDPGRQRAQPWVEAVERYDVFMTD